MENINDVIRSVFNESILSTTHAGAERVIRRDAINFFIDNKVFGPVVPEMIKSEMINRFVNIDNKMINISDGSSRSSNVTHHYIPALHFEKIDDVPSIIKFNVIDTTVVISTSLYKKMVKNHQFNDNHMKINIIDDKVSNVSFSVRRIAFENVSQLSNVSIMMDKNIKAETPHNNSIVFSSYSTVGLKDITSGIKSADNVYTLFLNYDASVELNNIIQDIRKQYRPKGMRFTLTSEEQQLRRQKISDLLNSTFSNFNGLRQIYVLNSHNNKRDVWTRDANTDLWTVDII